MECHVRVTGGWTKARDLDPTHYWGWECSCGQSCAGYEDEQSARVDAREHMSHVIHEN